MELVSSEVLLVENPLIHCVDIEPNLSYSQIRVLVLLVCIKLDMLLYVIVLVWLEWVERIDKNILSAGMHNKKWHIRVMVLNRLYLLLQWLDSNIYFTVDRPV